MKKIALIFGLLFITMFGCGWLLDVCKTIGIKCTPVIFDSNSPDYYEGSYIETDTFLNKISFKINGEFDCEAWAERVFSMRYCGYNTCYATSKGIEFKNFPDTSTFKLTLDKQITYENVVIPPYTDLFNYSITSKLLNIKEFNATHIPFWIIDFTNEFYQKAEFGQGYTTFDFSCLTNDSLEFIDSVKVYMN
jgi:hypothetical protein